MARGGAGGDAKDRICAGEDGKAIAQAHTREDNREEFSDIRDTAGILTEALS
jgi:hypothetical protein